MLRYTCKIIISLLHINPIKCPIPLRADKPFPEEAETIQVDRERQGRFANMADVVALQTG